MTEHAHNCTDKVTILIAAKMFVGVSLGWVGLPGGSAGKESSCSVGDLGLLPGLGRSPGEGKGYPLQYSGLESPMDCAVHEIPKTWTQLSTFHFTSSPEWVANHAVTCVCDILPDGLGIAGVSHSSGVPAPPRAPTYPQHVS